MDTLSPRPALRRPALAAALLAALSTSACAPMLLKDGQAAIQSAGAALGFKNTAAGVEALYACVAAKGGRAQITKTLSAGIQAEDGIALRPGQRTHALILEKKAEASLPPTQYLISPGGYDIRATQSAARDQSQYPMPDITGTYAGSADIATGTLDRALFDAENSISCGDFLTAPHLPTYLKQQNIPDKVPYNPETGFVTPYKVIQPSAPTVAPTAPATPAHPPPPPMLPGMTPPPKNTSLY